MKKEYVVSCDPGTADLGVLFNGIGGVTVQRVYGAGSRADVVVEDSAIHAVRRRAENGHCQMQMRLGSLPLL